MDVFLKEYFSKNLSVVSSETELREAYSLMLEKNIRHLPVVDGGRLVGIISDRDFQRAMQSKVEDHDEFRLSRVDFDQNGTVRQYMSWPVKTVDEEIELRQVALRMIEEKVSAFLVTRGDTLVGIVTTEDLLRVLAALLEGPANKWKVAVEKLAYNSPIGRIAESLGNAGL